MADELTCGGRSHRFCIFTRSEGIQERQLRLPHSKIETSRVNAVSGFEHLVRLFCCHKRLTIRRSANN